MSNLHAFKCVVESYRHSSTRKRGSLLSSGAEYRRRAWLCTTVEESWDSRHRLTLDTLHDDATRRESSFCVDISVSLHFPWLHISVLLVYSECDDWEASPRLCYFEFHKNVFKMAYLNRCSDFFSIVVDTHYDHFRNIPIFLTVTLL